MKKRRLPPPSIVLFRDSTGAPMRLNLIAPVTGPPGSGGYFSTAVGRDPTSALYHNRYDTLCDRRGMRRFFLSRHWAVPDRTRMFLRGEWAALHGAKHPQTLYDSASNTLCPRPCFDMSVPWAEPSEALWSALAEFGTGELPVYALDRISEVDPTFWAALTAPPHETVIAFLKGKNK